MREHVGQSYALAHPKLRQGLSREEWGTGEIPVQYYPVDAARWRLDFQYADELGLAVYVVPRRGADLRPMVFDMSMKPVDATGGRRWLVAPYGDVAWVKNARAAGRVTLARGRRVERVALAEVGPEESAPVLRRYVTEVPITRPYFDAGPASDLAAFRAEAHRHPVFRVVGSAP